MYSVHVKNNPDLINCYTFGDVLKGYAKENVILILMKWYLSEWLFRNGEVSNNGCAAEDRETCSAVLLECWLSCLYCR